VFALGAAALAALTFAASQAGAATIAKPLGHAQVLKIALRLAKLDGDSHPSQVMLASGHLQKAVKVFDPAAHPTRLGLEKLGGAKSLVDLVAMRGHFTSSGPHPIHTPKPKGKVLELIMNAHTGAVFGVSLGPKLRVPLSRLGPVTRLQ
jgi:hypothetical protein